MLKSELSNVEACVGIILNHKEIINYTSNEKGQISLFDRIDNACADLKQRMISEVFGPAKDYVIRRYVQFHQAGLVTLSDVVFQHLRSINEPLVPGKTDLLIHTLGTLQQLLDYISRQFYTYFDNIHGITQFQSDQTSNRFRTEIEQIAPLLEKAAIDQTLADAFLRSMEECLDNLRVKTISHDQQRYFDHLLQLIKFHLESDETDTISFAKLLYRQNYNSTYFEVWYRENFLHLNHRKSITEAQLIAIEPVIEAHGIFPHRQSLDVLLREWIASVSGHPLSILKKQKNHESISERLPLILSVPQLALFVRLCYLEGCFQISNISNIMRFFTDHFETKKQSHISVKSFSRAFYTSEQATAAMVRDFLQRMVGVIDKTYFPKT